MKKTRYKLLILLMVALLASGCAAQADTSSQAVTSQSSISASQMQAQPSAETIWDSGNATLITLSGDSAQIGGTGAQMQDKTLTISAAGVYVLSGTLQDGQIFVNASANDTVQLVLNGAQISCSDRAPIYFAQVKQGVLTLASGSQNTVSDGGAAAYTQTTEDEVDAAVYCQDDLTINGSGKLTVSAQYKHGIGCKDNLIITEGELDVTAQSDGIRGRDSITVKAGSFTVNAQGDAMQSNNDTQADKGWILLEGGTFQLTAGNDGIQAQTHLDITGGEFHLTTGSQSTTAQTDTEAGSAKGLKAGTDLRIGGGTFQIQSVDDCIHANASVEILAGTYTLSSQDDAIHADTALSVAGGTIEITECYEGLEGSTVSVTGGEIRLTARDDGINAGGGDDTARGNGPKQDSFGTVSADCWIRISAGTIIVDASGDGIDSNGNLYIDGGTLLVNGPTDSGNGALDYDGTCEITGGVLVTAGSAGMMQTPSSTSTQNTLAIVFSSRQEAGTLVHVADAQGNSILALAPSKSFESVLISSPQLQQGATYHFSMGGTYSGESANGLYMGGSYSGGTQAVQVTLNGVMTSVSEDGTAANIGMGPGGGRGGFDTNPKERMLRSPSTQSTTIQQNLVGA